MCFLESRISVRPRRNRCAICSRNRKCTQPIHAARVDLVSASIASTARSRTRFCVASLPLTRRPPAPFLHRRRANARLEGRRPAGSSSSRSASSSIAASDNISALQNGRVNLQKRRVQQPHPPSSASLSSPSSCPCSSLSCHHGFSGRCRAGSLEALHLSCRHCLACAHELPEDLARGPRGQLVCPEAL